MGKTDSSQQSSSDDAIAQTGGDENDAAEAARQAQLTFFDTVMPPTMTTENPSPAEAEHMPSETTSPEPVFADSVPEAVASEATQVAQATSDPGGSDLVAEDPHDDAPEPVQISESLGQRLRAAREARGLRVEEAAQRMKLPFGTVQALEADRYDRIGEGIYLRSYLTKYLRLLDLPLVLAERVLAQQPLPPPLTTSGTISRPRYLFERYSSSALYLILTAVIIVPAVWLAMRAGFEPGVAHITPLDGPDTAATSSAQVPANTSPAAGSDGAAVAEHRNDEAPLVASLAPFPALKHESVDTPAETPVSTNIPAGQHLLRLKLVEASWVEIVAADGEKLEYGLLPAGTVRTYRSAKAIDVRLGNSTGASVDVDNKPQDLAPFRRSNVAHFRLSGGDIAASHSGG